MKKQKMNYEEKMAKIDQYANSSNEICMNNNNSKLGMACLSIPLPICSCDPKAPCFKGCYTQKGHQACTNVLGAYYRNFRIYNEDPEEFFEQIYYKVKFSGLPLVRYHDSGDIPDYKYFELMCSTALKLPSIKFMAFTKKYKIVNDYLDSGKEIPENLNVIFSAWDKLWEVPNPHNLPIAYVSFKEERFTPEIPKCAFHCPGRESSCSACRMCWNKNLKAVYFDQH